MPAPPCHQPGDIVVGNVGDQLVLAEKLDRIAQLPFGVAGSRMVLSDFLPVTPSHVIEPQRRARGLGLRNGLLRLLALGALYRFGFTPGRGFGAAVKAMTVDSELEVEERRARLAVEGHGSSLRV